VEWAGVASFLTTMRPHLAVLEPGHFSGFNRCLDSSRALRISILPRKTPNTMENNRQFYMV
jgi:hypothetical protein